MYIFVACVNVVVCQLMTVVIPEFLFRSIFRMSIMGIGHLSLVLFIPNLK